MSRILIFFQNLAARLTWTQVQIFGQFAFFGALTGIGDATAFLLAARAAAKPKIGWEFILAPVLFAVSGLTWTTSAWFLNRLGVEATELQFFVWFIIMGIVVPMVSREFFKWPLDVQVAAAIVFAGVGYIMYRVG